MCLVGKHRNDAGWWRDLPAKKTHITLFQQVKYAAIRSYRRGERALWKYHRTFQPEYPLEMICAFLLHQGKGHRAVVLTREGSILYRYMYIYNKGR